MSNETTNNTLLLGSVLKTDKLSRTKSLDRYKNLRIVIKHKKKLYVLEHPVHASHASNAPCTDIDAYEKPADEL